MKTMNKQNQNGTAPVDQRTQDLVNASIDGEISAIEQDELDRLLLSSESIRQFDKELRAVTNLLNDLPELEPPPYLQGAIERQVRLPAGGAARKKPSGLFSWLDSSMWRTGLALAAGAVLTISVYEMGSKPVSIDDARNMSGTIVKHGNASRQGEVIDSLRLDSAQLAGLVELRSENGLFTVDVQLNSGVPVDVVVDFAGRGLVLEGASNSSDSGDAVSFGDGEIRIASNGTDHFNVKFRRTSETQNSGPIALDFYAGERLVKKAELNISDY
jgi:hypothetical protein